MMTVDSILSSLYDSDAAAAQALGVKHRSAVSNWRNWGYFPARLIPKLTADAAAKNIALAVADIPVLQDKRAGAA